MKFTELNLTTLAVNETTYSIRPAVLLGNLSLLTSVPFITSWLTEKGFTKSSWIDLIATIEMLEYWSLGSRNNMNGKKDGLCYVSYETLREKFHTKKTLFGRELRSSEIGEVKVGIAKVDHPFTRAFMTSGSYKNFDDTETRGFCPTPFLIDTLVKYKSDYLGHIEGVAATNRMSGRISSAKVVTINLDYKYVDRVTKTTAKTKRALAEALGVGLLEFKRKAWRERIEAVKVDKSSSDGNCYGIELDGFVLYSVNGTFYVNRPGYCVDIYRDKENPERLFKKDTAKKGYDETRFTEKTLHIPLSIKEADLITFEDSINELRESYSKSVSEGKSNTRLAQEVIKSLDVALTIRQNFIKVDNSIYQQDIKYRQSKFGRYFSLSVENIFNPQALTRRERKHLFKTQYSYDIEACHPALMKSICSLFNIELPYVTDYINNKKYHRAQLAESLGVDTQLIKDAFNAATNGSTLNDKEFKSVRSHPFIKGFLKDIRTAKQYAIKWFDFEGKGITLEARQYLPYVLQQTESKIITRVLQNLRGTTMLIHDGFYSLHNEDLEIIQAEKEVLKELKMAVSFGLEKEPV